MDLLNTSFFKHLFFRYILKKYGYFGETTCGIFARYLLNKGISNSFTNLFDGRIYNNNIVKLSFNYKNLLLEILKNPVVFKEYDVFTLLSGYSFMNDGHLIVIYIEKQEDQNYKISIINSGDGLEYHGPALEEKHPVIIEIHDVTFDNIILLIQFTCVMTNSEIQDEIKEINEFKENVYIVN